jgi:hypothetical protein
MSPRGTKQTVATHRTAPRAYSPDDIKARLIEAAKRERLTIVPIWKSTSAILIRRARR